MQRSPHETDSFVWPVIFTSVNLKSLLIIAQYFYYAKILARDRFIPPVIFAHVNLLLFHRIFVMQRSLHETDSFHQLFLNRFDQLFTRVNGYYCTVFLLCKDPRTRQILLLCKDPRTRQIRPVIYTRRQSLLLHSIFVMKRSPHYSRQIGPVIYMRQSLLLDSIFVMQRSSHIIC